MKELIQKLERYGADINGVMERFLDDVELYETCLKMFMDDEGFEGLEQALNEKSYEEAFDHAHTLKGVAGNLGLIPLSDVISIIVEQLRRKEYSQLEEQLKAVQEEKLVVKSIVESN